MAQRPHSNALSPFSIYLEMLISFYNCNIILVDIILVVFVLFYERMDLILSTKPTLSIELITELYFH